MASQYDYNIASEADVNKEASRRIWYYFIALGVLLFFMILGLTIMYDFQVGYEKGIKIGEIDTKESLDQKALSKSYLSGKRGLFENKHYVAIDVAIDKFIDNVRKAR